MALLTVLDLGDWKNKIANQDYGVQQALKSAISEKVKNQTLTHWQTEFAKVDACVEPVLSMNEAFEHPHFIARGMITEAEDEAGTVIKQISTSLPFKSQPPYTSGGKLGANSVEVLQQLGYSDEEIERLRENRCI
jgi:crotonobetainyl-CoA:carnitine CoA-transferase CaiB-like acyl-CoA transferase